MSQTMNYMDETNQIHTVILLYLFLSDICGFEEFRSDLNLLSRVQETNFPTSIKSSKSKGNILGSVPRNTLKRIRQRAQIKDLDSKYHQNGGSTPQKWFYLVKRFKFRKKTDIILINIIRPQINNFLSDRKAIRPLFLWVLAFWPFEYWKFFIFFGFSKIWRFNRLIEGVVESLSDLGGSYLFDVKLC